MTAQVHDDVLSKQDIHRLLQFNDLQDDLVDARPDFTTKRPIWDHDDFPQDILTRALDQVLDDRYQVQSVVFVTSRGSFRLHTDSAETYDDSMYNVVLLPLRFSGVATTVLFDNHYLGPGSVFGRSDIGPYRYRLQTRHGEFVWIEDLRTLLEQCRDEPHTVKDFAVTADFISELQTLVERRATVKPRVSDYREITNYDSEATIDEEIYQQYLNHIPREDLKGLKVHTIYQWQPGQALTFPRTQVHCAGAGHDSKVGVSIWTTRRC
jgi:hypothetical protein